MSIEPMERIPLGRTGETIPVVGVGTSDYRAGVGPLRRAIDLGADFIDTAELYKTEDVVGDAVQGIRNRVFIATKVWPDNFKRDDVLAAADRSLKLLRTDVIDLYQLHFPRADVPIGETMGAMEDLVDAGKVRFIGVSNFSVAQLREAQGAMTRHPIVSNQVSFSLLDRKAAVDLFPYCASQGITIIAHSPLGSGFGGLQRRDKSHALPRIGALHGKTSAQVALNWCIGSGPLSVIPKTNSPQRIDENCGAAGWRLTTAERAALEASVQPSRNRSALEVAARRRVRAVLNWVSRQREARAAR